MSLEKIEVTTSGDGHVETRDLPVLDLGDYLSGDESKKQTLAEELRFASETVGFLALKNHGIPQSLLDRAITENERFSALSLDEKLKIQINRDQRGFIPPRATLIKHSTYNANTKFDLNETTVFATDYPADNPHVKAGKQFYAKNQWPENLPGFKEVVEEYMAAMEALGKKLLPLWALALELPEDFFQPYFKENYTYSLKVTPPTKPSREPLEWFLLEQPPAHCEYFASGTAILLRMAGVPCRYIIGFVVSEQNQYSGEWVARNEDAHAWVEAYDETVGWVTVDSTPASGVPDNSSGPSSTQLYEYLRGEFHRIRTGWQQRGFAPIRATLKAIIRSPIGLALISIVTLFATGIMLRLWQRHRYVDRAAYTASTPIVEQLQTARQKIDVALKRVWRARLPGETVDRYAQQLANAATDQHDPLTKAADWYTQYAKLRFAPGPDHRSVIDIAARASQLTTVLRKRVRQPDEHQNNV